jgi:hypothetical protein
MIKILWECLRSSVGRATVSYELLLKKEVRSRKMKNFKRLFNKNELKSEEVPA